MEVPSVKIKISLTPSEWEALIKLAEIETRSLNDQIRHIIRMELLNKKLLDYWGYDDAGHDER